ncbi:MAG: CBS domain-containing protein [Pirellulaceae bacterium]|nr:CBS domain-containing protein [Pirellulaceae bacterium]
MKTAEDMVRDKGGEIISVEADSTIHQALQVMVDHRVGAILIRENDQIVGIWTERDLMRNTLIEGFDPEEARIGDCMVAPIRSAPHTDTVYNLMDKFLGLRLRHLPIEKHGEYIGLLSVGDVMKASLQEKTRELEALNAVVSWEYYEDWHWTSLQQAHEEMDRELERPSEEIVH